MVRLRSIGDAVLMTALTQAIHDALPDLRIHALLEPAAAGLLSGHRTLAGVREVPPTLTGRLAALRAIRRQRFSVAIDLHGGPTAATLTRWSGARRRIGLDHYRNRRAYDVRLPAPYKSSAPHLAQHTVETNLLLAAALGLERPEAMPSLEPSAAGRAEAERALAPAAASDRGYIAIHPGAALRSKTWPIDRFLQLSRLLAGDGHPIVIIRAPELSVAGELPSGVRLLPPLSLPGLLAVLSRARLFVGNDSGPAHMAAAAGTPTVAIFGSQNPRVWRPWGAAHSALSAELDCSPCPGFRCDNPRQFACLADIPVERVHTTVRRHLGA